MDAAAKRFVRSFLSHVDHSGPVADFLFTQCGPDVAGCLHDGVVPSPSTALQVAKQSAVSAVYVAQRTDSKEVLAELVHKERRKTILRAVASNKHLSLETATTLLEWGLANDDDPVVRGVCYTSDMTWQILAEVMSNHQSSQSVPHHRFASLVAQDGTDEAFTALLAFDNSQLNLKLMASVNNDPEKVSRLLDLVPVEHKPSMLASHFRASGKVGEAEAWTLRDLFDDNPQDGNTHVQELFRVLRDVEFTEKSVSVLTKSPTAKLRKVVFTSPLLSNEEAHSLYLDQDMPMVAVRAAETDDSFLKSKVIQSGNTAGIATLLRAKLSSEHVAELIDVLSSAPETATSSLFTQVWQNVDELDSAYKLALLRLGTLHDTASWMTIPPDGSKSPQLGELTALLEDPGLAFGAARYYTSPSNPRDPGPDTVSERARALLKLNKKYNPLIAEAIDLVESPLSPPIGNSQQAFARIVELLFARFGENVEAFQLAISLAPDWSGTIPQLVDTVFHMTSTPSA